jgi:hypothetical protein
MKTKATNEGREKAVAARAFGGTCRETCLKVLAQIREARQAILAESRDALKVPEQVLKLALNEAEALAWQTVYPHFLFPALAMEKVQDVAAWDQRQRLLGGQTRPPAF